MFDNEKDIDLISPLHIYKIFSEIENESHKTIEDLNETKKQKEAADLELKQLCNEKRTLSMSLNEVANESKRYDKRIKELVVKGGSLKKDIAECVNEAHKLMNEHKQAQEKLQKVNFDPTFYQNKLTHLREEIQKANEKLLICKKQYQEDFQKYGFSLKREQKTIKETPKPEPQLSALDELRLERESRQQVSLNLDDK